MSELSERIQQRMQKQEILGSRRQAQIAQELAEQSTKDAQRQADELEIRRRDERLSRQVQKLGVEVAALLVESNIEPRPIWARKPDRKRQDVSTHGIPGGQTIRQIRGLFQTGLGWHVYTESFGGEAESPRKKTLYGLRDNGEIFEFAQSSITLDHPTHHNKPKIDVSGLIHPSYLEGEKAALATLTNRDDTNFFEEGVASLLRGRDPAHFHKKDSKKQGEQEKYIHINP